MVTTAESVNPNLRDTAFTHLFAYTPSCFMRLSAITDSNHARGFGMRVVGGKTGADGRLFAYIVWTVPGGPAEKNGLQQGDKILEWNGMSLIDRSFEEVCSIMDRTGDIVELLVEHATDFRMCDLFDENLPPGNSGGQSGPHPETTTDKSPASPTRRKLPKTPEQIMREKQVSGRVQIQVWYHAERNELVVSLMAADDLALRDEAYGHGNLPEAYAKVRILPKCGDGSVQQTEVSRPTQNPIWNATLTFAHVNADSLMDRYIDIQLWDLVPHTESIFLGECNIELQQAFLDDHAIWCRLEDPKGLRGISISKSPSVSPRGSLATGCPGGDVSRLLRRDYNMQRSISDEVDSIGDGTSLLHPDHAWIAGSRRGSSQSETLEVEVYQLGKDFSRSLPGSRRSSFQDPEKIREEDVMVPPPTTYLAGRRRSSAARRDPDEILKSLKAVRGELGRAMSLNTEPNNKRPTSRREYTVLIYLLMRFEQIMREKQVSGRVQIQVWYHAERNELVVSLMAADDLALRDEAYGHGNLPEAYAKVRILPKCGDGSVQQTEVSRPTQNPIWNATLTFAHVNADSLMDRYIDIQLWDLVPHTESIFLGECNIELQQAFLDDHAIWCRLEDPKGLRGISISKSPSVSPRGSLATGCPGGDVSRLLRRDYNMQRSISDEVDSIGDGTSLLHPDHAWIAGSRRGSSQSETLEVEVYQLGKDFSRSLPGSRRSSFQDPEKIREEDVMVPPPTTYLAGRRRSSAARRDPDEILKSLKAVRGELGRAMSLNTEPNNKRPTSRRTSRVGLPSGPNSRKSSILDLTQQQQQQQQQHLPIGIGNTATSPPSDDENKRFTPRWKGSGGNLPPQTAKQALSMLKQAASVSNVTQGTEKTNFLSISDSPKNIRKGSMINLPNESNALSAAQQRKGSIMNLKGTESLPHQRKSSVFVAGGGSTNSPIQRKGSMYVSSGLSVGTDSPATTRKASVFNLNPSDSPSMLRKQSVAPMSGSAKNLTSLGGSIGNISNMSAMSATTSMETNYGLKLGPGQIHPKGYRLTTVRHGELKMGFIKIKGNVEVEIICARNIVPVDCETPPDTYVKCYIKDGDRLRHKKKTRVIRHSAEPFYKQTIKYQSSDVFGRNIVIMLWQRCVGFEHNQGLGGTEVNLDKLNMAQHIGGWYPLFPMHSYGGSDSDNSP
ncbi:regulating synaptic membrane exocytosis protein 2-like [Teleopsis dalmanni]|uniref:regulating synaptic membrane exocytosis protein 2-like n=1 Tax=Teleopsis dalmanni TaxID=139649 RepID=UPI0018CF5724|nr:regulating synaptic membrane exocytosis protein 2-like [Teleopsis dalmanni]